MGKIRGVLPLALAVALALLAATAVATPLSLLQWKVSLLATEYGHVFILICLGAGVWLWRAGPRGAWAGAALLAGAAAIFAQPFMTARALAPGWKVQLEETFGPVGEMVGFVGLWRGLGPPVVPERREVNGLALDFYRAVSPSPAPWVVVVHGGGWNGGNNRQVRELNSHLARRGIAVAAVSYRLAPGSRWPAQREDIAAAVAHLKTNARELGLDPGRWALLGRSAGGHVAAAAAYAAKDPSLKGLIAFYAPADLFFAYVHAEEDDIIHSRALVRGLLGGAPAEKPLAYKDGSPIEAAGAACPPTLLLHGSRDLLTWVVQSRRLQDRLRAAGARSLLIELPWAVHGFDFNPRGPGGQVSRAAVDAFLDAVFLRK